MSRLERLESLLSAKRHALDVANAEAANARAKLDAAKDALTQWQEAQDVLQRAAEATQNLVHSQIAGVVTRCLKAVYGEGVSFDIAFERKRGKTEARLFFRKADNEVDPLEASSIGMCELAAFALRLTVLKLHEPPLAQVMILDEPFRAVEAGLRPKVARLLAELAEETGIQIVLISHDKEFIVGKVIPID